jgi:hypothetical protein
LCLVHCHVHGYYPVWLSLWIVLILPGNQILILIHPSYLQHFLDLLDWLHSHAHGNHPGPVWFLLWIVLILPGIQILILIHPSYLQHFLDSDLLDWLDQENIPLQELYL